MHSVEDSPCWLKKSRRVEGRSGLAIYRDDLYLNNCFGSSGTGIGDPSKASSIILTIACFIVIPRITHSALKLSRISLGMSLMKMETILCSFRG